MDLHNSQKFSMDFSKAWRSAAVQLRVYQSRWSTLLAQKSLVWIPHSRGWMRHRAKPFSSFFILQILMILPCKRCCHLLSLSFRRRHSHRPVCKGWCHPAQSHEYLFSSSFGLHKKPLTYCMCCWTNCTTGTSILHHHIILLVVIVYDCIYIYMTS